MNVERAIALRTLNVERQNSDKASTNSKALKNDCARNVPLNIRNSSDAECSRLTASYLKPVRVAAVAIRLRWKFVYELELRPAMVSMNRRLRGRLTKHTIKAIVC